MEHRIFVSEGLSQQARKFKELATTFVAVNNMTLQELLKEICNFEKQQDCPNFANYSPFMYISCKKLAKNGRFTGIRFGTPFANNRANKKGPIWTNTLTRGKTK